ncbi:MAG TPA: hypothetical protein VFV33_13455 [Gemmatimonadaceae bacterium]|nr:hypothetical protein [Gemmatimonadaceae bacterium]
MLGRILCAAATAAVLSVSLFQAPTYAAVSNTPVAGFPEFNDVVHSLAKRGDVVYVGGEFTRVVDSAGSHVRRGAAAVNINTGRVLPWNPKVRGDVHRVVAAKDGIYLAGEFTRVQGVARNNLAKVGPKAAAKLDRAFRPSTNGAVHALALGPRRVFVGGDFTRVNGKVRTRLASFNRGGGFALTKWRPAARNGDVRDLLRTRAGVYVAGEFRELNGRPTFQRLAMLNGSTGRVIRSFNPATQWVVIDIHVTRSRVYAGVGGPRGGEARAFQRADGANIFSRRFDGDVQAVTVWQGEVLVGGHFDVICNTLAAAPGGACVDGSTTRRRAASLDTAGQLTSWNPEGNSDLGITSFVVAGGALAVGGDFTAMNGNTTPAVRFAKFNAR